MSDFESKLHLDEMTEGERIKMIRESEKDSLILAGFMLEDNPDVIRVGENMYRYNGKCYDLISDTDLDAMFLDFCIKYGITKAWPKVNMTIRAFLVYPGKTKIDKMNDYENLICLNNGILNIHTKEFIPHSKDYYFDSFVKIDYDPEAKECPVFVDYLNNTFNGDKETIANIIRLGGYLLDTSCAAERMFIFDGGGANGKSVLINTFQLMFSEDQITPLSLDVMASNSFSKELLIKSRVNFCAEQKKGFLDSEELKKIITGDKIEINRKFKIALSFTPKTKIVVACNGMPTFKDTTHAIYRRLLIIRFKNRYLSAQDYYKLNDPKSSNAYIQDKQLFPKIKKEISAILNLFISGLIDLRKNDYQFMDSSDSQKAMTEYKKDSDTAREFLEDNYELDDNGSISISEIYEHYREWYRRNVQDYGTMKFRKNEMAKRIKDVFFIDSFARSAFKNLENNKLERTTLYKLRRINNVDDDLPEEFKKNI